MGALTPAAPDGNLGQRMLLELRLAARIGATLYAPTHLLLAILDFRYAPRPWEGLAARALSIAVVWLLVWSLHARIKDARRLHWINHAVYAAVMAPVFWIGLQMPETFLVGFLPSLVALAVFLPGHAVDLWIANGLSAGAGLAFLGLSSADFGAAPDPYLAVAVVNMGLIAAGGSYLAARRRAEAARWFKVARRLEEVLGFGELLSGLGLLRPEQVAELRRLAEGREDYGREQFLKELVARGQITPFQAETILDKGIAALRVGDWLITERRGEGGMGEVYRLRHLQTGAEAALKRILPAALAQPGALARFRREARVTAGLGHQNIVRTLDIIEEDGRPGLILEYVEGGSLADLLERGMRLEPKPARRLAMDIASALDHAHQKGLVHRDLKPGNILLTKDGVAKLSDFGIVQVMQGATATALTQSGAVLGTIDYLAPEQAGDSGRVDIRADLYSLGCTLYHALSGLVPFDADTPVKKILAHQTSEPAPLRRLAPAVPPEFAAVIHKLMAKDAAHRYQTPAELLDALRQVQVE